MSKRKRTEISVSFKLGELRGAEVACRLRAEACLENEERLAAAAWTKLSKKFADAGEELLRRINGKEARRG